MTSARINEDITHTIDGLCEVLSSPAGFQAHGNSGAIILGLGRGNMEKDIEDKISKIYLNGNAWKWHRITVGL